MLNLNCTYILHVFFFQRKGVFGNFVHVEEFSCFLFPLENDLMSMEMNDCYKVLINILHFDLVVVLRKLLYKCTEHSAAFWYYFKRIVN